MSLFTIIVCLHVVYYTFSYYCLFTCCCLHVPTIIVHVVVYIFQLLLFVCMRSPCIDLTIEALQHKVFPGTEMEIFNDQFFQAQDIVVNALDNVEARRYVDR